MQVSGRGRGIKELDLSAVFATDEERSALSLVRSLDLSHNLLTQVVSLTPLASLSTLDVSHNHIRLLKALPRTLTRVDVSFNQLSSLDGLAELPLLEELDVSHNRVANLTALRDAEALRVLKASSNRIATTDGIDGLLGLSVLLLDHNLVSSGDELARLANLTQLEVVSFAGCPVENMEGYREYMVARFRKVLTIDGSPNTELLPHARPQPRTVAASGAAANASSAPSRPISGGRGARSHDAASAAKGHRLGDVSSSSLAQHQGEESSFAAPFANATAATRRGPTAPSHHPSVAAGVSHDTSVASNTSGTAVPLTTVSAGEIIRQLRRQLLDAQILVEQTQKEADRWRHKHRSLEEQLGEARRVIRDQLEELTSLREVRDAQMDQLRTMRGKLDRAERNYKYQQERHHAETARLAEEFERERALFDVQSSDMRQRLADAADPAGLSVRRRGGSARKRRGASHVDSQPPPTTPSKKGALDEVGVADDDVSSATATSLAKQLKDWMTAEMRRQGVSETKERQRDRSRRGEDGASEVRAGEGVGSISSSSSSSSLSSPDTSARGTKGSEGNMDRHRQQRPRSPQKQRRAAERASSPRSAARNITELWRRNESRLHKS